MSRPDNRIKFEHPVPQEVITDQTFQDIADDLFFEQIDYGIEYHKQIAEHGWGDDDTDYFRTYLTAVESLMDISYDGSRTDLVRFLFTSRNKYAEDTESKDKRRTNKYNFEPLHAIDSAGGLCESLHKYTQRLYDEEDE